MLYLFFYPLDFTFVLSTRNNHCIFFSNRIKEFEDGGIYAIGCSGWFSLSYFAWRETPVGNGGIQRATNPLLQILAKTNLKRLQEADLRRTAIKRFFLPDEDGTVSRCWLLMIWPLEENIDDDDCWVDTMLLFTNEHGESFVQLAGQNRDDGKAEQLRGCW